MADKQRGISLLIEVADKFSAPFKQMAKTAEAMTAPLQRVQQRLKAIATMGGLAAIGNRLKGLGGSIAGLGQAAQATMGKLAMLGLTGGGLLWGFKRAFLDDAAASEQLILSLHGVAGGAGQAAAEYQRLSGFAQANALDVAGVAAAYRSVRQAGGQAPEALLQRMGDTAAGTKKSFEEVGKVIASAMQGEVSGVASIDPGIKARDIGNRLLFTWQENGRKMHAVVAKRNRQMIAGTLAALWSKKHKGAMDTYSRTWEGMWARAGSVWTTFTRQVMASGPFEHLKSRLAGLLDAVETMASNGELAAWAETTGAKLIEMFDALETGVKTGWRWLQWLSDKLGGWSNTVLAGLGAVGLFLGGPMLVSLALVGKAVIALGATIMATPVGWFLAACAAIAAWAYIIWDQWEPIKQYFADLWEGIRAAFDEGWVEGIWAVLTRLNVFKLIADGINGLVKHLSGVDLYAEGERLFNRLWDGLKATWDRITGWVQTQMDALTEWMPDWVKSELGITLTPTMGKLDGATADPGVAGQRRAARDLLSVPSDFNIGDAAASAIDQASAANVAALQKASLKSELLIRADLPPGFAIEPRASQGNVRIDRQALGPMMAGG